MQMQAIGREGELALLQRLVTPDGPRVALIHGIAGMGKSTFMHALENEFQEQQHPCVFLDGTEIQPTQSGFFAAFSVVTGAQCSSIEDVLENLSKYERPSVLLIDQYENLRLIDDWIRRSLIARAPADVHFCIATRQPHLAPWIRAVGSAQSLLAVALSELSIEGVAHLLSSASMDPELAADVHAVTKGHPLSVQLAIAAALEAGNSRLQRIRMDRVVDELTELYLEGIEEQAIRSAVEAMSVVRRATRENLQELAGADGNETAFTALSEISFVQRHADGLDLHPAVKEVIQQHLRATNPGRLLEYRRAAWNGLKHSIEKSGSAGQWRNMADTIFLIDNPVVRDAFFPPNVTDIYVEDARSEDGDAITAIIARHEVPASAPFMETWWQRHPETFRVARDQDGEVMGFYSAFYSEDVDPALLESDPITCAWYLDCREDAREHFPVNLFIRRWLSRDEGEAPSPVQAACWLDLKRTYLEIRPPLERVYLAVVNLEVYAEAATRLGFEVIEECAVQFDDVTLLTGRLCFGEDSVSGWLSGLLERELGLESTPAFEQPTAVDEVLLDVPARQLICEGVRIDLSPLEFGTMKVLTDHPGEAISRDRLLDEVWGLNHDGSSNVVDTVVAALRRKLGDRSALIQSVRGVGYRFIGE